MRSIRTWTGSIASRRQGRVAQRETRETGKHEICPRCGTSILSSRMSLREMVLMALCGSLLFSILVCAFLIAEPWLEDAAAASLIEWSGTSHLTVGICERFVHGSAFGPPYSGLRPRALALR